MSTFGSTGPQTEQYAAWLEDALVSQWWGDDWREKVPDAPTYLRVFVTDSPPEYDDGEALTDFVARLAKKPPTEAEG